jgi:hypothetical protein
LLFAVGGVVLAGGQTDAPRLGGLVADRIVLSGACSAIRPCRGSGRRSQPGLIGYWPADDIVPNFIPAAGQLDVAIVLRRILWASVDPLLDEY